MNRKSTQRLLAILTIVAIVIGFVRKDDILQYLIFGSTKNAVALSQNCAYDTNATNFYETPEGVIINCDERHAVSNDLPRYHYSDESVGQFMFSISAEEMYNNPWSICEQSMTITSNCKIHKAECFNIEGKIISEEKPENNTVTIGGDCAKFILYIMHGHTMYYAKFSKGVG